MGFICKNRISREQLFQQEIPARENLISETYTPIKHQDLFQLVLDASAKQGLELVNEVHGLAKEGLRYFGLLEFKGDEGGYGLNIGLRNAHDGQIVAGLALGSKVLVCENLSFSAEHTIGRRHSRNIHESLPELVNIGLTKALESKGGIAERFSSYKQRGISKTEANDLICEAVLKAEVLAPQYIAHVYKEYHEPRHPEFKDRSLWSLYNSFTQVFQETPLHAIPEKSNRLHRFFDALVKPAEVVQETDAVEFVSLG